LRKETIPRVGYHWAERPGTWAEQSLLDQAEYWAGNGSWAGIENIGVWA
jgi:hypothetical protein